MEKLLGAGAWVIVVVMLITSVTLAEVRAQKIDRIEERQIEVLQRLAHIEATINGGRVYR